MRFVKLSFNKSHSSDSENNYVLRLLIDFLITIIHGGNFKIDPIMITILVRTQSGIFW
jgi:hypothetical protein